MIFRGCFDVFPWWPSHWKWPKEDSRFTFSGYKVLATRPSKDLVRLLSLIFLVHWQIFPNFARGGRIRKSPILTPLSVKQTEFALVRPPPPSPPPSEDINTVFETKVLKSRRNVCLFLQIISDCTGAEHCKLCTFAKRSLYFQGIYVFTFS